MATEDDGKKSGWTKLGGATVHIGDDGKIDAGCEGLVGHSADPDHLEATREQRDAKQDAAEAAGWQSAESQRAEELHAQAAQHAPPGTLVFVRIGDKYRTYGHHAAAAQAHLQMGDGKEAEFDHEHLEDHLKTLTSKGHRVALVERTDDGQARPQAQVGPEHAPHLDEDAGDQASDPGRAPAVSDDDVDARLREHLANWTKTADLEKSMQQPPAPPVTPQQPKPGDIVPMPQIGDYPAKNLKVFETGEDGTVSLGLESDQRGRVKVPIAAYKHFVNDMAGRVDLPPSGDPLIDAVTSGQSQWLGKGDDGIAFAVGDKVVKASTVVPFIPENYRGMLPDEAKARLQRQGAIQNELASLIPAVLPVEVKAHGDKSFLVMQRVQPVDPKQATPEQLAQVRGIMKAMHAAGYALNDEPQFGIDESGAVKMFDTGKAKKTTDKYAFEGDQDSLSAIFSRSGQVLQRFGDQAGRAVKAWDLMRGRLKDPAYATSATAKERFANAVESAKSMAEDNPEGSEQSLAKLRADAEAYGLPADAFDDPIDLETWEPESKAATEQPAYNATTPIAERVKKAPPQIKHAIEAMHTLPDVQQSGTGKTEKLGAGYSQAVYDHLTKIPGGSDGFGQVHDLSEHLGPGAIGYHSPAGMLALQPPQWDGGQWQAHYSTDVDQAKEEAQQATAVDDYDPWADPGDAAEADDSQEFDQEHAARVTQELEKMTAPHANLKAAVEEAFPGDVHSQAAAAEMAIAAWKPYADYMTNLKNGRYNMLNAIHANPGLAAAFARRAAMGGGAKRKDATKQGSLATASRWEDMGGQMRQDHEHEYPELFTPHVKDPRTGLLRPNVNGMGEDGKVLDAERDAAFLENMGRNPEEFDPLTPDSHQFLGAAIASLAHYGQQKDRDLDDSVPFSKRGYYRTQYRKWCQAAPVRQATMAAMGLWKGEK